MCMWVAVKIRAPFLGTPNIRCRIIIRTQKGTLILTITHVALRKAEGSGLWQQMAKAPGPESQNMTKNPPP